jgi:S1/P1 Nuclease
VSHIHSSFILFFALLWKCLLSMRPCAALLLSCCLLWPFPAFSWWENGHRTVARIAAANLTPAARVRVARILNVPDNPGAIADALAVASTWADETKNETHTGEWHYIDLTLQDSKSDILKRCEKNNCVSARIRLFASQLSGHKTEGRWSELDALRFLVHFVGDVHQPMHAVSDADLGGNCERLEPPIGDAKNLHALWDGQIIEAMDASDRDLAENLQKYFSALDEARQKEFSGGDVDDWVWESHKLAQEDIYSKLHIPVEPVRFPHNCGEAPSEITDFHPQIDTLYIDTMKPVVRDQLLKAGLRLARTLNESL